MFFHNERIAKAKYTGAPVWAAVDPLVASLDPLSYGVDGLRSALIGNPFFGLTLDLKIQL
jgi:hypothetical protein